MTYCNCILNNIMIGAFIYILRVHHVFHAHTIHELLGYVGGGVTHRVCYFVLLYRCYLSTQIFHFLSAIVGKKCWVYYGSVR
jgi:hypothetical protein